MSNATITLDQDAAAAIRKMLLVGLSSVCEIERVLDAIERATDIGEGDIPASRVPDHPTGDDGTVAAFANTLRLLG